MDVKATTEEEERVVVVDACAIIRGQTFSFYQPGVRFYTTIESIEEVKDARGREKLATLPFELEIKSPSESAMRTVTSFSKQSGDFAMLSINDLKLIALTFEVESALNGAAHLRTSPACSEAFKNAIASANGRMGPKFLTQPSIATESIVGSVESDTTQDKPDRADVVDGSPEANKVEETGAEDKKCHVEKEDDEEGEEEEDYEDYEYEDYEDEEGDYDYEEEDNENGAQDQPPTDESIDLFIEEDFPTLGGGVASLSLDMEGTESKIETLSWGKLTFSADQKMKPLASKPKSSGAHSKDGQLVSEVLGGDSTKSSKSASVTSAQVIMSRANGPESRILSNSMKSSSTKMTATDDDGVGWITPGNINSCKFSGAGMIGSTGLTKLTSSDSKRSKHRVACLTSDFTMQNVLMQIGLQIMSIDGMIVQNIRRWVLRCAACFNVHHKMESMFCSRCGSASLQRIAASIDKKTGQLKLHLKKNFTASIRGTKYSLPKPGQQGKYNGELLLREDQLLTGIWRQKMFKNQREIKSAFGEEITSDVGLHLIKNPKLKIGLGHANPNARKGRERRGQKKKHSK